MNPQSTQPIPKPDWTRPSEGDPGADWDNPAEAQAVPNWTHPDPSNQGPDWTAPGRQGPESWTDPFVVGAPVPIDSEWERADWQKIWFATQGTPWRTLAVVPGDGKTGSLEIATLLMMIGRRHGEPVYVADLRRVTPRYSRAFSEIIGWHVAQGDRVVLATCATSENISTIPLARAADCALLCVTLGATPIRGVEDTIAQIGKERFLGSVVLRAIPEAQSTQRVPWNRRLGAAS